MDDTEIERALKEKTEQHSEDGFWKAYDRLRLEGKLSNFVEKIRICLSFHLTLDYVCNQLGEGAKRIRGKPQQEIILKTDLLFT
jgi:4-alpha-glucanotransferase